MLEVASGVRLEQASEAAQTTVRSNLIELVVRRFTAGIERLLHEGLARGYRHEEANATTFRGRLLVAEDARRNSVRPDRAL